MNNQPQQSIGIVEHNERQHRETTLAERILWERLRDNRIGFRFRRYRLTGAPVPDIVCPEGKLVIEVLGPHHQSGSPEEIRRRELLLSRGYHLLQFTDREVLMQRTKVFSRILDVLM